MSKIEPPRFSIDLSGQVAFVSGAFSGLGIRFAQVLAHCGAKVAVTGRRKDLLESVAADINEVGGCAVPIEVDVSSRESIRQAVQAVEDALGLITTLVNNAGIVHDVLAHEMSDERADSVFATNMQGPYSLSCEVARRLIAAGRPGKMVNISSIGALNYGGYGGVALYSVTKAGLLRMTEVLAVEWARHGINVNCIVPGAFDTAALEGVKQRYGDITRVFPRKRIGTAEQLDSTLLYLVSPSSDFVTGTYIIVDDAQNPR